MGEEEEGGGAGDLGDRDGFGRVRGPAEDGGVEGGGAGEGGGGDFEPADAAVGEGALGLGFSGVVSLKGLWKGNGVREGEREGEDLRYDRWTWLLGLMFVSM